MGHDPLARLAMLVGHFLLTLFSLVTGFALFGKGTQAGSWPRAVEDAAARRYGLLR